MTNPAKEIRITFLTSAEMREYLEAEAKANDMTISQLIRFLIKQQMETK